MTENFFQIERAIYMAITIRLLLHIHKEKYEKINE